MDHTLVSDAAVTGQNPVILPNAKVYEYILYMTWDTQKALAGSKILLDPMH